MKKLTLFVMMCVCMSLQAQSTKKTVILYNVVPVDASISSDGEIMEIYGRNDSYLRGYNIVKQDHTLPIAETSLDDSGQMVNGLYTVVKKNFNLLYENDKATLTRSIIQNLDDASDAVFLYPSNKILITPYLSKNLSGRSKVLFDNRLKSILSYLEIKGLQKDQIIISKDEQTNETAQIIVTVIE